MELSPVATLVLTEYLLSRHDQYCRGHLAVDGDRNPVDPTDASARAWSIEGAIARITQHPAGNKVNQRAAEILLRVGQNRGYKSLEDMRDMHYRRAVNTIREAVIVAGGH